MTMHRYSSLAAFLAHRRALRSASALDAEDRNRLAAMEQFLSVLGPAEREAIDSESADPAVARHRERAENRLRRELIARGVIDG